MSLVYSHLYTLVPSLIELPSTEKWYSWPSGSVKTKCSFATRFDNGVSKLIASGIVEEFSQDLLKRSISGKVYKRC